MTDLSPGSRWKFKYDIPDVLIEWCDDRQHVLGLTLAGLAVIEALDANEEGSEDPRIAEIRAALVNWDGGRWGAIHALKKIRTLVGEW